MIQREREKVLRTGQESNPQERGLTPLELLKKETDERLDRILPVPELKPLGPARFDLQINSTSAKTLYETLAGTCSINVLWDPDLANSPLPPVKNGNVNFQNSTLGEALDYLAVITKTYWKPISSNAIFVTTDSRQKRTDYADNVLRVFFFRTFNRRPNYRKS